MPPPHSGVIGTLLLPIAARRRPQIEVDGRQQLQPIWVKLLPFVFKALH